MRKVAVPSDDGVTVARHFGRSRGFVVFTFEGHTRRSEFRRMLDEAPETCEACEGPARHRTIVRAIEDCDAVIATGMGPHMLQTLADAGIEISFTYATKATDAVDRFARVDSMQVVVKNACTFGH